MATARVHQDTCDQLPVARDIIRMNEVQEAPSDPGFHRRAENPSEAGVLVSDDAVRVEEKDQNRTVRAHDRRFSSLSGGAHRARDRRWPASPGRPHYTASR